MDDPIEQFEGVVPWLYLDTRGNVTVGVGYMVATALAAIGLTLVHPDGTAASASEKAAEWKRVKAMPPARPASHYALPGGLRMPPQAVSALLDATEKSVWRQLRLPFPEIDDYPEPVQLALLDMGYNLGVSKLEREYCCESCHFGPAVLRRDWPTCAAQCRRQGIGDARNEWTRQQFLSASSSPPGGPPDSA